MRLTAALLLIVCVWLGVAASAVPVSANATTQQAQAETSLGPLDRFTVWVYKEQRKFHRALTGHLSELRATGSLSVAWGLIVASFLYGVFHAAGPGHGKAVMTGYLLSQRETARRGILLATLAAFCQGLVAVVIVYGIVGLIGLVPRDAQTAVTWSERASFTLVILLGAMLLFRAARRIVKRMTAKTAADKHHRHHHDDNGHTHDHDDCCGHAHAPTLAQVEQASDLKTAAAVVLSIGIRPCTGAVLVLVFASATGLTWAGLAAVLAMSAGTALTVSGLAVAAVGIRDAAWKVPYLSGARAVWAGDVVYCMAGLAIVWIGGSLLFEAMRPAHPLFSS